MNFLERIPTRWLLIGAGLACLALWAAPSSAQTAPDPVLGEALFNDTPNVLNVPPSVFNRCTDCHNSVQDRRIKIGGSAFADLSFDNVVARLRGQINGQAADKMGQYRALDADQINNIAAYIADTPKLSTATLTFASTGSQSVKLSSAIATTDSLKINSVAIAGTGAGKFSVNGACTGVTIAANQGCTVSVTYTATDSTFANPTLTFTAHQGSSATALTRTVALQAGTPPVTPPPAGGSSDSGGGALGWIWLSGLALATLVLARRRG
jgi:cytochrome c553